MKKGKLLGIFLFMAIILTGCGDKTLSCVKEEDIDFSKVNEKQVITFSNNKIKLYEAEMIIQLNDDTKDYADLLLSSLEEPFSDYKDKKGIEYKTNKKDNNISLTFSADYSKMDKETKKSLGISEDSSLEKTKKSLEDDGYTCK